MRIHPLITGTLGMATAILAGLSMDDIVAFAIYTTATVIFIGKTTHELYLRGPLS